MRPNASCSRRISRRARNTSAALKHGVQVTVDNLFVLQQWLDDFRARSVFVRIDTGTGRGHHHHVRTAGAQSKFGVPVEELDEVARLAKLAA